MLQQETQFNIEEYIGCVGLNHIQSESTVVDDTQQSTQEPQFEKLPKIVFNPGDESNFFQRDFYFPDEQQSPEVEQMTPWHSFIERQKDISFDESSSSLEQESKERQLNRKTKKKKNNQGTKNILINFRKHFVDYLEEHHPTAKDDKVIKAFKEKKCMNKEDYEKLFSIEKYRQTLSQMFKQRYLYREFQNSRASNESREVYLKKIPIFRVAFEERWFPRIC